ncbi:MAG: YhbY family RNA-binding protein [Cocleimonas sp.]|nr:YhbY family RNA-binding protein [Cocleimonas sp.]
MNNLSNTQKKQLKGMAHSLKPVVMIGQHGMKESIDNEVANAIKYHQLIKIKVGLGDRDARDELIEQIVTTHNAILVQRIGNIAVLYRFNPQKGKLDGLS